MKPYDCAIIGAGPAGAVAAYELARLGRAVALVEKAELPRYKPCGGGVSPQIQNWLDFELWPAVSCIATAIRATWRLGDPVEGELPDGACLWMVHREVFDHFLAIKAVERGARLFERTEAHHGRWTGSGWVIECCLADRADPPDRFRLEASYVIAADGAKGQAAKWLGFTRRARRLAGAFEAEVPQAAARQGGPVHLEFGMIQGGYLWNFPKADGHSIGIGAFKGEAPRNMRELLAHYSDNFGIDLATAEPHGHPVALWDGHFPLNGRNCLLAGEAACLVDPFTAEGIRPAVFSGLQAARAVHAALEGKARALQGYTRLMREEHGADMMWARRIAKVFYAFPKVAYEYGVKDPAAFRFLGKLLSGRARYRDIARHGITTLRRGLSQS